MQRRGAAAASKKAADSEAAEHDGKASGKVSGSGKAEKANGPEITASHVPFMERYEDYVPIALTALAALTRFYRIDLPAYVIFDESHFGRFTNQYCAGTYLFDIHPPLGKLVLYWVALLVGYDYTKCGYDNIEDAYGPDCKFLALRITAATFGTLTVPIVYHIVRGWGGGVWTGILGALFFNFDNLNLLESRLILVDSQLMFWCALCVLTAQRWWQRLNRHEDARAALCTALGDDPTRTRAQLQLVQAAAARMQPAPAAGSAESAAHAALLEKPVPDSLQLTVRSHKTDVQAALQDLLPLRERIGWIVAMGVVTSSALSIKWTALATPGMIAIESFFGFFFLRRRAAPLSDLLPILAIAVSLYFTWFAVHFYLLPLSGDGDAFMRGDFQKTLVGNPNYDPAAPHPGLFSSFAYLNAEMLRANAGIEKRHHWESVWWEWPLNLRGVLYSSTKQENTYSYIVYLLGNPAVIWIVGALVALAIVASALYLRYRHDPSLALQQRFGWAVFAPIGYCLWTYWLNLLPYILVARSAFSYHYMPALLYAEVLGALLVEQLVGRKRMQHAAIVLAAIILSVWLVFSPWVYGFPLTTEGHARRRWLPRWD